MAVSLFASCAPTLLQKSRAVTWPANRFTCPHPSSQAVCPLQLPPERDSGAVCGTCSLLTQEIDLPRAGRWMRSTTLEQICYY